MQEIDPDAGSNISQAGWNDVIFLSCLVLVQPLIWTSDPMGKALYG